MSGPDYTCPHGTADCASSPFNLGAPELIIQRCDRINFLKVDLTGENAADGSNTFTWKIDGSEWWFCLACHRELTLRDLGRQQHMIEEDVFI